MAGQARPRQEPQFQRQRTLVLGSLKTSLARALAGVSRAAAASGNVHVIRPVLHVLHLDTSTDLGSGLA